MLELLLRGRVCFYINWKRFNATVPQKKQEAVVLLWALLASGQITMRKVDGWQTLAQPIEPMKLDLVA
jgi:hypothetical protein